MYEKFTPNARKAMQLANQEAQRFNHEYIGTEHILLALTKLEQCTAAKCLKEIKDNEILKRIWFNLEQRIPSGPEMVTMGKLPQTPRARKVIEYTLEFGRDLNSDTFGTEHLMMGLLRESEGLAYTVLQENEISLAQFKEVIAEKFAFEERNSVKKSLPSCKTPLINQYCIDLSGIAAERTMAPDHLDCDVVEEIATALNRMRRNNVFLIGNFDRSQLAAQCLVNSFEQANSDNDWRFVKHSFLQGDIRKSKADRFRSILQEMANSFHHVLYIENFVDMTSESEWPIRVDELFLPYCRLPQVRILVWGTEKDWQDLIKNCLPLAYCFSRIELPALTKLQLQKWTEFQAMKLQRCHIVEIEPAAIEFSVETALATDNNDSDFAISLLDIAGSQLHRDEQKKERTSEVIRLERAIRYLCDREEFLVASNYPKRSAKIRNELENQFSERKKLAPLPKVTPAHVRSALEFL